MTDLSTDSISLLDEIHRLKKNNHVLRERMSEMEAENRRLQMAADQSGRAAADCQRTLRDIMSYVVLVVSENRQKQREELTRLHGGSREVP